VYWIRKGVDERNQMRRLLVLAMVGALAALAATGPASAKGPSAASLTGPGLGHALPIEGEGEGGTGTPLGSLTQLGGFFPQVFLEVPDPTKQARPAGDLGPRYRVTYRVPGPNGAADTLVQDVYPYAETPVTYMQPGQHFWDTNRTHGGWFVAGPELKTTLVATGLPKSPPVSGGSFPWAWTVAGVVAVAALLVLVLRRRSIIRFRPLRTTA
jgi:hypothetical protein